jgi:riboflavin synthase
MNECADRFSPHLNPYTVEVKSRGDYGVGDSANIAVDPAARRMACLL